MEKELIAKTANDQDVYLNDETMEHILSAHPDMTKDLIAEAIEKIHFEHGTEFTRHSEAVDMGRIVGKSSITTLKPEDQPVKLHRTGRDGDSNILFKNEKEDTNLVFIAMGYIPDQGVYLFTAAFGPDAPREPFEEMSPEERAVSEAFWNEHAIVVTPEEEDQIIDDEDKEHDNDGDRGDDGDDIGDDDPGDIGD